MFSSDHHDRLARFVDAAERASAAIWISRIEDPSQAGSAQGTGALANRLLAVKDNIDVAGFATTAACPEFAYEPQHSAVVVERLLAEGATVVGKTNLDQFACGLVGTRSPFGEVPNALNPDFVSGGSSSGSAVAVSLGLVDIALGTDTAGSGRIPAAFNNIVGIKPSRGLLSLRGTVAACRHLDCVSIFARTVPEAMQVLELAAAYDPLDPFSEPMMLDARFLRDRPRIGIARQDQLEFFGDQSARSAFALALELVSSLDGTLEAVDIAPFVKAAEALYDDAWVAERYTAIRYFFEVHKASMDPVVREIIDAGRRFSASDVFLAMQRLASYRQATLPLWKHLDMLVVPTAPTHPTRAAVRRAPLVRNHELGYYTNFVNLLDLAAIAVPAVMRADGLPFGVTLIGPAGSELRLGDFAARLHEASGLALGAGTERPRPAPIAPFPRPAGSTVQVVVVGAHLSGFPLNTQLIERGARRLALTRTAPCYRLYRIPESQPAKPGLVRAAPGEAGCAIEVEVWEMPMDGYGSFVAAIAWPLGIGSVELEDGRRLQGFVCEPGALDGARDISSFGGWRAYQSTVAREGAHA